MTTLLWLGLATWLTNMKQWANKRLTFQGYPEAIPLLWYGHPLLALNSRQS